MKTSYGKKQEYDQITISFCEEGDSRELHATQLLDENINDMKYIKKYVISDFDKPLDSATEDIREDVVEKMVDLLGEV
jgi:hypothetical protein